jgi:hypothetical protein
MSIESPSTELISSLRPGVPTFPSNVGGSPIQLDPGARLGQSFDSMRQTMKAQVSKRIARKHGNVFLRADFADLGGYEQVGHALRQLVRDGRLVKIGSGLYARARPSMLDGIPTPVRGLRALADEALRRLGITTAPTRFEQDYSAGQTTQVPAGRRLAVNRRVRRKIGYNGVTMSFERSRPSRPWAGYGGHSERPGRQGPRNRSLPAHRKIPGPG